SEDPASIRAEILADAPGAIEIGDRRAAIQAAIDMMQPGDLVLVAGKGHETGQIVGETVIPFSDHNAVREALAHRSWTRTTSRHWPYGRGTSLLRHQGRDRTGSLIGRLLACRSTDAPCRKMTCSSR